MASTLSEAVNSDVGRRARVPRTVGITTGASLRLARAVSIAGAVGERVLRPG